MASESATPIAASSSSSSASSDGDPVSALTASVFSSLSPLTQLSSFMLQPADAASAASSYFSSSPSLLQSSPLYTANSLLSSTAQQSFSAEQMQALLSSLGASAAGIGGSASSLSSMSAAGSGASFPPLLPMSSPLSIQFLPPGTVLVPLSSLPSSAAAVPAALRHPKLLTFAPSSIQHTDIPSCLPPSSPAASRMELSSFASPVTPVSPPSSDTDSETPLPRSSSSAASASAAPSSPPGSARQSSAGGKVAGVKRPSVSYAETDNDSSSSSDDSHSTDSSSSSDGGHESKKRRCVVSALKLPAESQLELSLSVVYFQQHSIRIIHTYDRRLAVRHCYVHGADVGGVIERKSNISRMFGQFSSPREKLLMNVTGKHNHTVGQEANVLTVEGVLRLIQLKKCQPNVEYTAWLRDVLLPTLMHDDQQQEQRHALQHHPPLSQHHAAPAAEEQHRRELTVEVQKMIKAELVSGEMAAATTSALPARKVTAEVKQSDGETTPLDLMASVCV